MSRVAVSRQVLGWAVERSSVSVAELEGKFPKILEWLTGESLPTLRDLEALARETLTPLGYFFLSEPPDERLPMPYFRTLAEGPSPKPRSLSE